MINLRSELRRRLLGFYFANPRASQYLRELAQRLGVDPANLSRELSSLEREGLFLSHTRGRQKYFRLNRDYPLYQEYRRIVLKTAGAAGRLRELLANLAGVEQAYLYGSFARNRADAQSDIDVLVVGRPDPAQLEMAITKLERQLDRDINYVLMSPREFTTRRAGGDSFLKDIWRHERVTLVAAS